jgi:hypothetical protein
VADGDEGLVTLGTQLCTSGTVCFSQNTPRLDFTLLTIYTLVLRQAIL